MIYILQNQHRIRPYLGWTLLFVFLLLIRFSTYMQGNILLFLGACMWGIFIFLIKGILPEPYMPERVIRVKRVIMEHAVIGAMFYIAVQYIVAAITGSLAASPYILSPVGIFYNILRVVPSFIFREFLRDYLISSVWYKKKRAVNIVLITFVIFMAELNIQRILQLTDFKTGFIYFAQDVMPYLAESTLLSFMSFYGGALPCILYLCIVKIPVFLIPILPDLPWIARSAVGICFPIILAMLSLDSCVNQLKGAVNHKSTETVGFLITLFASVFFLWFCIGVFPVYPSVVLTGSMEPMIYPGDAVLIKKITEEKEIYKLEEGEIINFKREDITITHRIVDIIKDEAGNLLFQTKGDNNPSVDAQHVHPNDINGTITYVVPKVGYPVLFLKSEENIPEGVR